MSITLGVCGAWSAQTRAPWELTLDSLFYAARYDTLRTILPALIHDAETRGDSAALGRLTFQRGRVEITLGHQAIASREFDRALRLTQAARDTVGLLPALHFKAFVLRDQGHPADAMVLFERELDLATRAHVMSGQGSAIGNLAYRDLRRGRLESAKAGFARSMRLYRQTGNPYLIASGALNLGMLHRALGNPDSTRYWFNDALRICREHHYPLNELWALNNLGWLEADLGNQELATTYYAAALAIGRRIGFDRGIALPLMNLASTWSYLGEFDRARAALNEAIEVSRRAGFKDLEDSNTNLLGQLLLETGRNRQAAAAFRRIVNAEFVFNASERSMAVCGLALALAELDSVETATHALEPFVSPRVDAPDHMIQPFLEVTCAELLRRQGRYQEALARAAAVRDDADRAGRTGLGVSARLIESSCRRALGDAPGAVAALRTAMDSLEVARVQTGQAQWREAYGQHIVDDVIEGCRVLLEYPGEAPRAERVRAFYDALQRFKTRTLLERIRDPRGDRAVPIADTFGNAIGLGRLQRGMLHDGELLLDMVVSPAETFLFAVSPDSCRLVSLPGSHSALAGQMELYAGVLSTRSSETRDGYSPARIAAMQQSLGRVILGPVADLIAKADRVFIAPDGCYTFIPLGTLTDGSGADMLMEARDVVEVPSAAVLAWARANRAGKTTRMQMIAVADGDDSARSGAFREVAALQNRYAGVHRFDASAGVLDTLIQRASPGCILHIAAHARVMDDSPWQSGFILQSGAGSGAIPAADPGVRPEEMLRAWEIARVKLPYAMAVLAGCETAAGRATRGEGVLGLTSAFLSADVPVVVSSRWAVDDHATAILMQHFYDRLAAGETVASALRDAQLAVRRNRRTSHPFYWAGFAVVGDGSRVIRPTVTERHPSAWLRLGLLALALAAVAAWFFHRRRPSPAGT
ncbi:MAG TPA: CHAT domain-containing tetratricopeptide repeat protein [Candidatus Krumholzibacteria bacterium]|nr:CHAT domain-containing tetratricopeptide repeat protein [Candidatus Krumholzibacteria bacterium]